MKEIGYDAKKMPLGKLAYLLLYIIIQVTLEILQFKKDMMSLWAYRKLSRKIKGEMNIQNFQDSFLH